jgi:hypothetical protein
MKKTATMEVTKKSENHVYSFEILRETTPDKILNSVLARLIDEVKNDEKILTNHSYNRFHNRHNR